MISCSIHQFPPGMHIHEYLRAAYSYKLDRREMIKARSPAGGCIDKIVNSVVYEINSLGLLEGKAPYMLLWRALSLV